MKRTLLALLILGVLPASFFAQGIFQHLELNVGYGVQHQDRRLFEYGDAYNLLAKENKFYDHQLDVNINATVWSKSIFSVAAGVGYSLFRSQFTRPFDAKYFGDGSQVLHYSGTYDLHNISMINTNKLVLNADSNAAISLLIPLRADFTVDKHMTTSEGWEKLNRSLFEFNKFEIYLGLQGKLHRFTLSALVRVFNYQRIDPVYFNYLIFNSSHPPFLDKKFETINYFKLMLNAGYVF